MFVFQTIFQFLVVVFFSIFDLVQDDCVKPIQPIKFGFPILGSCNSNGRCSTT